MNKCRSCGRGDEGCDCFPVTESRLPELTMGTYESLPKLKLNMDYESLPKLTELKLSDKFMVPLLSEVEITDTRHSFVPLPKFRGKTVIVFDPDDESETLYALQLMKSTIDLSGNPDNYASIFFPGKTKEKAVEAVDADFQCEGWDYMNCCGAAKPEEIIDPRSLSLAHAMSF